MAQPKISLIIPLLNEEKNLAELTAEMIATMSKIGAPYEIIFIDDGSSDASFAVLTKLAQTHAPVSAIRLRRNYGQTAAMSAGIDAARGSIIIPLDADLQNDPADIPRLLAKLDEGFDIVSGWRRDRQDKRLSRILPSRLANWLISYITKVMLHDYGCTLKAYRAELLKEIRLYGEMHRFIPAYAAWHGARITEVVVHHRARRFGTTKYGISRTLRVILDLITVKFLTRYGTKPMHFFGRFGAGAVGLGIISGLIAIYLKIFNGVSFIITPLPLLTVFLFIIGGQFVLMGLLAEYLVRIYFEAPARPTYLVRERLQGGTAPDDRQLTV